MTKVKNNYLSFSTSNNTPRPGKKETSSFLMFFSHFGCSSKNSLQITIYKLNGKNYREWSQSMSLVTNKKEKFRHLNAKVKPPAIHHPKHRQWHSEILMLTSWLINTMEPIVGNPFMFLPMARGVWEAVSKTYSLDNHSR